MLYHGTISRWNDNKGFGFITQDNTKEEIFFHISDCPQHGVRPKIGFIVSYQRQQATNGKISARQIQGKAFIPQPNQPRGQARTNSHRGNSTSSRKSRNNSRLPGIALMLLVTAGIAGYASFSTRSSATATTSSGEPELSTIADSATNFSCDGRQHCSQMRSREEALFFIQHCPDTKMDSDSDGEPCESQFAN